MNGIKKIEKNIYLINLLYRYNIYIMGRWICENDVWKEVPDDWKKVPDASQQPQANTSSNLIGCSMGRDCPTSDKNKQSEQPRKQTRQQPQSYRFKKGDRVQNIHTRTFGTVVGDPQTVNTQSVLVYPVRFDVNPNVVELAPENTLGGPFPGGFL